MIRGAKGQFDGRYRWRIRIVINIVVVLCPDCAVEFRIAEILCETDDGGMAYLQFFSKSVEVIKHTSLKLLRT